MHDIFGHEAITGPWIRTLRILDVETEQPVPEAVRLAKGRSQQVANTMTAWVDVLVAPAQGRGVWIGAGGENASPYFAVVIPRDFIVAIPVRLDVAFEEKTIGQWSITAMSARLHDPADLPGELQHTWAALWEVLRTETLSDLGHAGMLARDRAVLENALADKQQSPVAAAIAATLLLRCDALEHLHDWPRNLANWFQWLPDGAVLWAETLLRRDDLAKRLDLAAHPRVMALDENPMLRDDAAEIRRLVAEPAYDEARHYFAMLANRGPPLLVGTLAMAVRQEKFFRRVVETQAITGQAEHDLKDACEVVRRAADYAMSDGLFAAFGSGAEELSPHVVLKGRQRRAEAAPQPALRPAIDPFNDARITSDSKNVTGFISVTLDVGAQLIDTLRKIAPKVTRLAVISDPSTRAGMGQHGSIVTRARQLEIALTTIPWADDAIEDDAIEDDVAAFAKTPNGGLIVPAGTRTPTRRQLIIRLAAEYRLPAVYPNSLYVRIGGLISYGDDTLHLYQQAGGYARQILFNEKKASELDIVTNSEFEIFIKQSTADALGLVVPTGLGTVIP